MANHFSFASIPFRQKLRLGFKPPISPISQQIPAATGKATEKNKATGSGELRIHGENIKRRNLLRAGKPLWMGMSNKMKNSCDW